MYAYVCMRDRWEFERNESVRGDGGKQPTLRIRLDLRHITQHFDTEFQNTGTYHENNIFQTVFVFISHIGFKFRLGIFMEHTHKYIQAV